jgi:uncharacterized membrane protein YphA (DoxX/SURF4 family)
VKAWAGLVARLVTGGVWIYAGALKLPDPDASVAAVRAYELLPGDSAVTVGHLLPILEVVVGAMLVLGVLVRGVAVVSALLFVAFVVGIISVWSRGIEIDCGCFGGGGYNPDATSRYPWEIARDTGLFALSVLLVWLPRSRWALDSVLFPHTHHLEDLEDLEDHEEHEDLEEHEAYEGS